MKFGYYIFGNYSENLLGYNLIEKEKIKVVKESELDKRGIEYKLRWVMDNMINIERLKNGKRE